MHLARRHRLSIAILAAVAAASVAGYPCPASAAPPMLTGLQKIADKELPAFALAGTGIGGAFNPGAMSSPQLTFTLPDGRAITALRQRTSESIAQGRKSWVGTFKEQPGSIAVITNFKGSVTGFVSYGTETWELMPGKAGAHVLYRVDDERLPKVEPEVAFPGGDNKDVLSGSTVGTSDATTAGSGGYVQDLLVVYTPASSAAHGQATLESMIQNAVVAANQAYQNSGIAITLNLVGLQQVSYVETGAIQTSLNELRGVGDGKLDDVHKLRDSVGADVVSLVSRDSDACGIAGVMTSVSTSFAANAFNVVNSRCLSNHSLAHEIGHNQGNKHDRASTTGSGAYPYSYGFRRCMSDGTGFRTVMAYSCSGANRVAWFSSPTAYYNGYATGIAYESDPTNSADNARSMMNTASTVASFRSGASSATSTPTSTPTAPAAPSGVAAAATAYNSVTVRWSDNSANETGFKLERSGNGVNYSEIATLGAGTTSMVDNGVVASSNFYYRVRAFNSVGNSAYSNVATVTTPAVPVPPPAAPSSVAARNDGDGSATVTWTDASTNETGFEVRREKWDTKYSVWSGLTTVGTVPSGFTSLDDMSGNGTYRYSVRAVNSGGASRLAGPASVTVTGGSTRGKSGK